MKKSKPVLPIKNQHKSDEVAMNGMGKKLFLCLSFFGISWSWALNPKDVLLLNLNPENEDLVRQVVGTCVSMSGHWSSQRNVVGHADKKCFDLTCSTLKNEVVLASCLPDEGKKAIVASLERRMKDAKWLAELEEDSADYLKKCSSTIDRVLIVPSEVKGKKNCYAYVCLSPEKQLQPVATVCQQNGQVMTEAVANPSIEHERPFECEYADSTHEEIICPNEMHYVLTKNKKVINAIRDSSKIKEESAKKGPAVGEKGENR